VYSKTGRQLLLVRDVNRPLSDEDERHLAELAGRFAHCVKGLHRENFAEPFAGRPEVLCPAGRSYFRIWNDGRVQGCPNLPGVESLSDNGNLKERRLRVNAEAFRCSMARFCDCAIIDDAGLMGATDAAESSRA
jgi:MoaA/NifB/PqqE/SkfB family radical SAM enzyme